MSAGHAPGSCGCCAAPAEPAAVFNRPGLPRIAYRSGTHPTILQRMLRRIPTEVVGEPGAERFPLAGLSTRSPDDPAVALLDAWATVADVLTFYQDRIANEGFLGTATERRSILELARAIGYELGPGVAASTYLAFGADPNPGSPKRVAVPAGTRIQSIPAPGKLPQTFETSSEIEARPEWNELRPQRTRPQVLTRETSTVYARGVATQLQPGDTILLVGDERLEAAGSERWDVRIVETVTPDTDNDRTAISWRRELGLGDRGTHPARRNVRLYAFRQRAALFGHNAPEWRTMPESVRKEFDPGGYAARTQWPNFTLGAADDDIPLDAGYPKVLQGSWVALSRPGWVELYRASGVDTTSRADFAITGKSTRVRPDTARNLGFFGVRRTTVHCQSEELQLAEEPMPARLEGSQIPLERLVAGIAAGRAVVVEGRPLAGATGETVAEVAFVDRVTDDGRRTTLWLTARLRNVYDRATVLINANVAPATHGETVREVLGSGNASLANQAFALKRPPLTYVSAATPSGSSSTLDVRVDGVRWSEAASLLGLAATAQGYVVRIDDDGTPRLVFGDGSQGARLPTGQENVTATYRTGIGPDGEVEAGSLTLLQTRPLGIRSVTNPTPASGAAAPERLDDARRNAPLTVLTLDRIVSLRDFEDFARSFAGIGKAQATALWDGRAWLVHVTVARPGGEPVDPSSALFRNLIAAVDAVRDPVRQVRVDSFEPLRFQVVAGVLVDESRIRADVVAAVEGALRNAFSFERRGFGQAVAASEVVAVIQAVPGVIAVDLDRLARVDAAGIPTGASQPDGLRAERARMAGGSVRPAQLLMLHAAGALIGSMTP